MTTRIGMALAFACAAFAAPSPAAQRTFVATTGNDANTALNCGLANPCRSFASALTVTDPGGEVVVQDSGGYGRVTIAQSVAIIAPAGVYAGISVFLATNGVDIDTPGVVVALRGLSLNGQGGTTGVRIGDAAAVELERLTIANLPTGIAVAGLTAPLVVRARDTRIEQTGTGIDLSGDVAFVGDGVSVQGATQACVDVADGARLGLARGVLSGCGRGSGLPALRVRSTGPVASATLDAMQVLDGAGAGADFRSFGTAAVYGTISRSTIARNAGDGVAILADLASGRANVTIESTTLTRNGGAGVRSGVGAAGAASLAVVDNSTVTDNSSFGFEKGTGGFITRGANLLYGNNGIGAQTSGSITALPGT
jgi:hypothetical protein